MLYIKLIIKLNSHQILNNNLCDALSNTFSFIFAQFTWMWVGNTTCIVFCANWRSVCKSCEFWWPLTLNYNCASKLHKITVQVICAHKTVRLTPCEQDGVQSGCPCTWVQLRFNYLRIYLRSSVLRFLIFVVSFHSSVWSTWNYLSCSVIVELVGERLGTS